MTIKFKELKEYLEVGTNKIVDTYKSMTPGEDLEEMSMDAQHKEISKALGKIQHKILHDKKGNMSIKVDQNDREDASNALKKLPKFMLGKIRLAESVEIEEASQKQKGKPPFDPDPKKKAGRNSDGSKTSPMSRARQLAKRGLKLKEVKDSKAYTKASKELRAVKDPIEGANLKKLSIILDRLGKVSLINSGDLLNQLNKIVTDMDTDVREVVFRILQKNGLMESSVNESIELEEKFSWNDVNDALTKANYMRGKPSEIEKVASKFKYKSGNDKNFSLDDIKKNLSAAGIDGSKQHNVMKHMKEQPEEEKPMMKGQIEAMDHYLEGIEEYLESTPDPEEWFQNKLTKAHNELSSLYSYSKGEDSDSDDVEESTKAYGKSMRAVADKKKRAAMSSSDKDKLGKLAAMLAKERGKRK